MDNNDFEFIDWREILRRTDGLAPLTESFPEHLRQLIQAAEQHWESGEMELAKQKMAAFNGYFDEFQVGRLLEIIFSFRELDVEATLKELDAVPAERRRIPSIAFCYHFLKALLHFRLLDIDEARKECTLAIRQNDAVEVVYFLRGTCLALREMHADAIPDFKRARKDGQLRDQVNANLAYSYLRTGQSLKALWLHRRIAPKFPQHDKVQYNTGLCFQRFRMFASAIAYFSKAILLNPSNIGYRLTRGVALMRRGRYKEAAEDLAMAAEAGNEVAGKLAKVNAEALQGKIDARTTQRLLRQCLGARSSKQG